MKGEVGSCRPRGLPKDAGAGEGAGGIRKQKEKARPSLTVKDFKNQSMVADKERAGKLDFSGSKSFWSAALRLMAANAKKKRQRNFPHYVIDVDFSLFPKDSPNNLW